MSDLLKNKQQELESDYANVVKNVKPTSYSEVDNIIKNNIELVTHAYNKEYFKVERSLGKFASPNALGGLAMRLMSAAKIKVEAPWLSFLSMETIIKAVPYLYPHDDIEYVDGLLCRVSTHKDFKDKISELALLSCPNNKPLIAHILKKYTLNEQTYANIIKLFPSNRDIITICIGKSEKSDLILKAVINVSRTGVFGMMIFELPYYFGVTYDRVSEYLFRYGNMDQITTAMKFGHNIHNMSKDVWHASMENSDINITKMTTLLYNDWDDYDLRSLLPTKNNDLIRFVLDNLPTKLKNIATYNASSLVYVNDEYILNKLFPLFDQNVKTSMLSSFGAGRDNLYLYKLIFGDDIKRAKIVRHNIGTLCPKILRYILSDQRDTNKTFEYNIYNSLESTVLECIEVLHEFGHIDMNHRSKYIFNRFTDSSNVNVFRSFIKMGYKVKINKSGYVKTGDTSMCLFYTKGCTDEYVLELIKYGIVFMKYRKEETNLIPHVDKYMRLVCLISDEHMKYFDIWPDIKEILIKKKAKECILKNRDAYLDVDIICQQ